jgi:hypothetical protein
MSTNQFASIRGYSRPLPHPSPSSPKKMARSPLKRTGPMGRNDDVSKPVIGGRARRPTNGPHLRHRLAVHRRRHRHAAHCSSVHFAAVPNSSARSAAPALPPVLPVSCTVALRSPTRPGNSPAALHSPAPTRCAVRRTGSIRYCSAGWLQPLPVAPDHSFRPAVRTSATRLQPPAPRAPFRSAVPPAPPMETRPGSPPPGCAPPLPEPHSPHPAPEFPRDFQMSVRPPAQMPAAAARTASAVPSPAAGA